MVKNAVNTLYTAFLRALFAEKKIHCVLLLSDSLLLMPYIKLCTIMGKKKSPPPIFLCNRYCKG